MEIGQKKDVITCVPAETPSLPQPKRELKPEPVKVPEKVPAGAPR